MARKAVLSGGKKDELIAAALKLFIANGYENTSVRSILDSVNGEVGMFYHYFHSKNEIFEAAVDLYLKQYAEDFSTAADESLSISEQLNTLLNLAEHSILNFNKLGSEHLHWSIAIALHQRTLLAILPTVEKMVAYVIKTGIATNPLRLPSKDLSSFLLFGISGILHQKQLAKLSQVEINEIRATAKLFFIHTLGIKQEELR